jgi:flagellar protein FliL
MKKTILKSIMLLGLFLGGGAAGAGAMYVFGKEGQPEKYDRTKSTRKEEIAHEANENEPKKIQMVQFQKDFTSNLLEAGRFLQLGISIGLQSGDKEEVDIKEYEAQLRSAVLAVLAEQSGTYLATASGKRHLQSELKLALNKSFEEMTGEALVDNVYFTSFIVQ